MHNWQFYSIFNSNIFSNPRRWEKAKLLMQCGVLPLVLIKNFFSATSFFRPALTVYQSSSLKIPVFRTSSIFFAVGRPRNSGLTTTFSRLPAVAGPRRTAVYKVFPLSGANKTPGLEMERGKKVEIRSRRDPAGDLNWNRSSVIADANTGFRIASLDAGQPLALLRWRVGSRIVPPHFPLSFRSPPPSPLPLFSSSLSLWLTFCSLLSP